MFVIFYLFDMDARVALLSDDKEKLVDEILELRERVKAQAEQIAALQEKLTKPPVSKKPDFVKASKPKGRPPHLWGRKKNHPGCTRPKPTQIDRTVDQTLSCCPSCQGPLNETQDASEHIQEDIVTPRVEVVRFVRHSYWCSSCHKDVTAPPAPEEVPHGYLGPQTLTTMVWLKYHLALPTNKIQAVLHDLCGLKVSQGAITQALQRLAGYLRIESDQVMRAIKEAAVKHVDETGWTINGVSHWLWAFVNDTWAYFRVDKSRGSQVPIGVLGETFTGVLVSDFHSSYNAKIHGLKQKCLVHLYRDIRESREDHPPPDFTAPEKKLKRLLADAKRLADRRDHFSPIVFLRRVRRLKDRLFHFATDVYSHKTWQRLSARLLKHYNSLFTFLDVPGLASDNNTAERAIKPHVIVRNRSFQNRTPAGADAHSVLTSLIQTLLLQKRPVMKELSRAYLHHRQGRSHPTHPPAPTLLFPHTTNATT
jgi:transposase